MLRKELRKVLWGALLLVMALAQISPSFYVAAMKLQEKYGMVSSRETEGLEGLHMSAGQEARIPRDVGSTITSSDNYLYRGSTFDGDHSGLPTVNTSIYINGLGQVGSDTEPLSPEGYLFWKEVDDNRFDLVKGGTLYLDDLHKLYKVLDQAKSPVKVEHPSTAEMVHNNVSPMIINKAEEFTKMLLEGTAKGELPEMQVYPTQSVLLNRKVRQSSSNDRVKSAKSEKECMDLFDKCNGHGSCKKKTTYDNEDIYVCVCNSYNPKDNVDEKVKKQKWAGDTCKYKDISTEFNMFLWVSIFLISIVVSCIFTFFSLGDSVPSIPTSGYVRPKVE